MPGRGASGGLAGALNLKINPTPNSGLDEPLQGRHFRLIVDD